MDWPTFWVSIGVSGVLSFIVSYIVAKWLS
jgi:hypothetical protein